MWNYIHADDFSKMVDMLMHSVECSGVYNIASEDTRLLKNYVEEIYSLSNMTGSFDYNRKEDKVDRKIGLNPDVSKVVKVTGWQAKVDFRTGVLRAMKERGYEIV